VNDEGLVGEAVLVKVSVALMGAGLIISRSMNEVGQVGRRSGSTQKASCLLPGSVWGMRSPETKACKWKVQTSPGRYTNGRSQLPCKHLEISGLRHFCLTSASQETIVIATISLCSISPLVCRASFDLSILLPDPQTYQWETQSSTDGRLSPAQLYRHSCFTVLGKSCDDR
jgi:hypothetical protein